VRLLSNGRPTTKGRPLDTVKNAGSQAGWALITGGVNSARVDVHRLHQLVLKVLKLVDTSPEKEHLYRVAGDLILGIPQKIERIEQQLDETSYALACMGEEHLKDRLPVSSRAKVEETIEGAPTFEAPMLHQSASRVAHRFLLKGTKLG
jgi:hypothetical protein